MEASAGLRGDMWLTAALDLGLSPARLRQALRGLGLTTARPLPRQAGEIIRWINCSNIPVPFRRRLIRVWTVLARAEAQAHRVPWARVRFHQLAGPDTWVAFCGVALALEQFRVRAMHVSRIPLGRFHIGHDGRGRNAPGPATRRLLRRFPVVHRPDRFEWTTPTGAALLAAFASPRPPPPFRVAAMGHGLGLRLLLGKPLL